ncbi:MAG: GTP cyclohydrolase I FolE2 [Dehalococcoidia bacterium]|nr:MAG: GTP cyclohydrolase I FolE2 [Dehalococcoidia bacterium]
MARGLPDVQNHEDQRGIELDKVGITNLYYPLRIRDKANGLQHVTAKMDILVGLHSRQRGAHFSHLISALNRYKTRTFGMDNLVHLLKEIRKQQDEEGIPFDSAYITISFRYFVEKTAPESKLKSLVGYDSGFEISLNKLGYKCVIVNVPVTTVCPCSKEISKEGAHNQRGVVTIKVYQRLSDKRIIWIEDLIKIAEQSASSDVYTLVRRVDEKHITEKMFSHPTFVEDVVRNVIVKLKDQVKNIEYFVKCENSESIHPHNAYAETSGEC